MIALSTTREGTDSVFTTAAGAANSVLAPRNTEHSHEQQIPSPYQLKSLLPLPERTAEVVRRTRNAAAAILERRDPRVIVVVGPCSIHDPLAAIEYARRLRTLSAETNDALLIIMRAYFEKPRTTVGWKGLINDPYIDESCRIHDGIMIARKLSIELGELGVPIAAEILDPLCFQFIDDLVSWAAVGARTCESQVHRQLVSGADFPVGFKNPTDGRLETIVEALVAASKAHNYLTIGALSGCAVARSRGNRLCHAVLRGGSKPNYDAGSVCRCEQLLAAAGFPLNIMIDCSHGNSGKDFRRQSAVLANCEEQIRAGNRSIAGLMIESNLEEGAQKVSAGRESLRFGVSITDACIGWEETSATVHRLADTIRKARLRHD